MIFTSGDHLGGLPKWSIQFILAPTNNTTSASSTQRSVHSGTNQQYNINLLYTEISSFWHQPTVQHQPPLHRDQFILAPTNSTTSTSSTQRSVHSGTNQQYDISLLYTEISSFWHQLTVRHQPPLYRDQFILAPTNNTTSASSTQRSVHSGTNQQYNIRLLL